MAAHIIFAWNKDLETGIELLDSQHKAFVKHANKLIIKVLSDKTEEGIIEEYEFLNDYLAYHFQVEETYMFDSGYPGYKEHQADHLRIKFEIRRIGTLIHQVANSEEAANDFVDFVKDWVLKHIMGDDLDFSRYYNEKKKEQ